MIMNVLIKLCLDENYLSLFSIQTNIRVYNTPNPEMCQRLKVCFIFNLLLLVYLLFTLVLKIF